MKKSHLILLIVAAVLLFFVIFLANRIPSEYLCGSKETIPQKNSVYYWRTFFSFNDAERRFLIDNEIKKIYVRFFDVDINRNPNFNDVCAPVASVEFSVFDLDSVQNSGIEIVPVVFITPEAIRSYSTFTDHLAHRLFAMCTDNNIDIKEVQFDCDWTTSTQQDYFTFLTDVREYLNQYFQDTLKISTTIRLHQLTQEAPKADYGVLMCYNTGDFKNFDTENSILDVKDVKQYVNRKLKDYPLPLTLALPTYSWCVEFDENKEFVCLNKSDCPVNDTTKYRLLSGNRYELIDRLPESATKYVRYEEVSAQTILEAKKLLSRYCSDKSVILYHLEAKQLSKYSDDEIQAFFN